MGVVSGVPPTSNSASAALSISCSLGVAYAISLLVLESSVNLDDGTSVWSWVNSALALAASAATPWSLYASNRGCCSPGPAASIFSSDVLIRACSSALVQASKRLLFGSSTSFVSGNNSWSIVNTLCGSTDVIA